MMLGTLSTLKVEAVVFGGHLSAGGQYPYENDDLLLGKAFLQGKNGPILIFKTGLVNSW